MNSKFEKNIRLFNIIISFLIIGTLQYDYFISKDFMLELIFNLGMTFILLVNIIRQYFNTIYSSIILSYIINGVLLLTALYCIGFLVLLNWGNGFSGKETPINLYIATSLNVLSIVLALIDLKLKSIIEESK